MTSSGGGNVEAFREIGKLREMAWVVTGVQAVVTTLFHTYYPLTRQFVFTYFASPALYGVLTSERFSSLQWWSCSWMALAIPFLWLIGRVMDRWRQRSYWKAWIICSCLGLALWLATWIMELVWLVQRNDPSFYDNPANSYRACCTPEFYNTVGACPNFEAPHPECDPSIDYGELGTNGDFVFYFGITFAYVVIWAMYIWLGFTLMKLVAIYNASFLGDTLKQQDNSGLTTPLLQVPDDETQLNSRFSVHGSSLVSSSAVPSSATTTMTTVPAILSSSVSRTVVQDRLKKGL